MANNTDWLNVAPMSGEAGQTPLSLTALSNNTLSAKTATVSAHNDTYNVTGTTTVTLKAFEPTLELSRSTLRFDSTGGTATFTVFSNTAWTITYPALVHSYSTSAGTGNTEVTVVVAENQDEVSKVDVGIVKDCFNVNQLYLTVVQESFIVDLVVWPTTDIEYINTGSSTSITIDSNADWEIECPSWVTPSITSGQSGVSFVTLTAGWNSGATDRSGTITVYSGSKYVTINAHQMNYIEPYLTVTPLSYTFPIYSSSTVFTVDSYPGWSVELISTGETLWGGDVAMEVFMTIPSSVTVNLGRSGALVNGVYVPGTTYTFLTAGTYSVQYPYAGPEVPVLSGNPYITNVTISDDIETIPDYAFYGCTSLSSIYIGSGLTTVGGGAFGGCSSLSEINIEAPYAPSVSENTFYGVATGGTLNYPYGSNYNFWLQPTPNYLGYYGWPGFNGQDYILAEYEVTSTTVATKILGSYQDGSYEALFNRILADNGDEIGTTNTGFTFTSTGRHSIKFWPKTDDISTLSGGKGLFQGCTDLVSVRFADTTRVTGHHCVADCPSLTSLTLNEGLQVIGNSFESNSPNCNVLDNIGNWPRTLKKIGNDNLTDKTMTSFVIPDGITVIGNSCFSNCSYLSSVTFPNTLVTLGGGAFNNCDSLSSVTLPNSLRGLFNAFNGCGALTSIEIPEGITQIGGNSAGYADGGITNCPSLTSVTFPSTLEIVYGYFLSGDDSLVRIYSKAMSPGNAGRAFAGFNYNNGILFKPVGSNYSAWWNSDRYGQHLSGHNWIMMDWDLNTYLWETEFSWKSGHTLVTIETPSAWTISCDKEWVSLSESSGTDGQHIVDVDITANSLKTERTATVTVQSGEKTSALTITQDGLVLSSSCSYIDFKAGVRRQNITITSPANWTISSSKGWVSFSETGGTTGETTVTVIADSYSGTYARTATIYILTTENERLEIPLRQSSAKDYITITYNIETTGDTKLYNVTSAATANFSAYSIDNGDWVDLSSYNTHSFEETGLHTVRYKMIDASILQYPVFSGCTAIVEADLGDCPIVTIGNTTITDAERNSKGYLFAGCTGLTAVTLPPTLVNLGSATFYNCYNMPSYQIPASVEKIGHYCFSHSDSALSETTAITFGNANEGSNLSKLYMCIIQGCAKLKNIYSYGMTNALGYNLGSETSHSSYGNYVFYGAASIGTLHTPKYSDYSQWMSWSNYWLGSGSNNWSRLEDL